MAGSTKTIFIFAYYSYKDPIFQSAVLPYFNGLAAGNNLRFVLITFEQQKYKLSAAEASKVKSELKEEGIIWYKCYWHSGKLKLIKKAFDFAWGILLSTYLIVRYRAVAIYSEGFPGAIIAHHLSRIFSLPHLVHTFEPHTDYMVEAGVWKETSWEARLLKKYEVKVAMGASHIFTATDAFIDKLKNMDSKAKLFRVPSCVDINTFRYSEEGRRLIRRNHCIEDDECVLTYLGKFGGMYMDEELFDFFSICEEAKDIRFRYFIFTPDPHSLVLKFIEEKGLDISKFLIKTLKREEISLYLSSSDVGLVPVRQNPSKRYCSPIKDGEYWACGLPIIIPEGISDDYIISTKENIGLVLSDMSRNSVIQCINELKEWRSNNPRELLIERCQTFVERDRSIDRYKRLYQEIFEAI
jgi:glycosyltransferase involved in cell wall biosynthesis